MGAEATGGTLRFSALAGLGGPVDPRNLTSVIAYHAVIGIYDFLALHDDSGLKLGVTESIASNEDATVWTLTVREGATFHDGRPVTADDLLHSIEFLGNWETSQIYAQYFFDVDWENTRAVDDRTMELALLRPRGDFLDSILALFVPVVPRGETDFTLPIGSGPFRIVSNDGVDGYELVRNDDWWGPRPAIDRIVTVPINDSTARINALKSGEIDFAYQLPPSIARAEEGNDEIVIERTNAGSSVMCFIMNTSLPPFDNSEVREAVRLAVDREALVNSVLLGQGDIGNDLPGKGLVGYHDGLPQRTRDLERATEIFAIHGITELDIVASEIAPGVVASAEILASQLAEAGVTLRIEEVPADAFFGDFERLLSTPLQAIYFVNRPPSVHMPSFVGSNAVFNPTASRSPELDEALLASQSAVDPDERERHLLRAQEIIWDEGAIVVWGYQQMILAYKPTISNVNLVSDGLVKFQELVISPT